MIIKIDTEKEMIVQAYAERFNLTVHDVRMRIKRGKLKVRYIKELKLKLIQL
jgi:ribosomal protein L23